MPTVHSPIDVADEVVHKLDQLGFARPLTSKTMVIYSGAVQCRAAQRVTRRFVIRRWMDGWMNLMQGMSGNCRQLFRQLVLPLLIIVRCVESQIIAAGLIFLLCEVHIFFSKTSLKEEKEKKMSDEEGYRSSEDEDYVPTGYIKHIMTQY